MLLAMTFATRFPLPPVLLGIFLGILANHGLAVLIGSQAGRLLPVTLIHPLSGILFLLFAFAGLRLSDDSGETETRSRYIWLACALAFFIGEFGDKTQLTALTLASTQPALPVLTGTVSAMMCTSLLSIWIGSRIGQKIPEQTMRLLSGIVFLFVGLLRLKDSMNLPVWLLLCAAAAAAYAVFAYRQRLQAKEALSPLQQQAEALKNQRDLLEKATQRMCLGQKNCGPCQGAACMVGYAKRLLQMNEKEERNVDLSGLIRKAYPQDTVREGLGLIVRYYALHGWDPDPLSAQNRLRNVFETILIGVPVQAESVEDYLEIIQSKEGSAYWSDLRNTL